MTIDEALAWADKPFLERVQLQMQGPPIPTDHDALDALAAEVRALRQRLDDVNVKDALKTREINILTNEVHELRQRHAAAVEAAFREGYNAAFVKAIGVPAFDGYLTPAWLASEAKARLT